MGMVPLSWQEISAYTNKLNLSIPNWELLAIKEMSSSYVGEYNQASDKDRLAPYAAVQEEPQKVDREKVNNDLKNAFKSLKRE